MHTVNENRAKLFEAIFNEIAVNIDRSIDPLLDFPYEKVLIRNQLGVLEKVLLHAEKNDSNVLEIGSGLGQVPSFFSCFGNNAVGGDLFPKKYSPKIWKILSKKYGCSFLKFDGLQLPFGSESFNTVIFLGVLEYINGKQPNFKHEADLQFIGEIQRVLKANGKLLMSVPNKYSFFKFPSTLKTLPKGYTDKEIRKMLAGLGFKLVMVWRDNFFPFRVRRISPVLERITSKIFKIYLIADTLFSKTILGITSTNLHYVFLKNPKTKATLDCQK
jgi:SAM-dependent methyltransferase